MATKNFTLTLTTDRSPKEVFDAVTNVRGWWSGYYSEEIIGNTEKQGDEFSFRAGGGAHFTRQRVVESVPNKRMVWLITESDLNFVEKNQEWTGTQVIFDISETGGKTKLIFTHEGLNPVFECYESCAPAWTSYLQNKLLPLINGAGA